MWLGESQQAKMVLKATKLLVRLVTVAVGLVVKLVML